MFVNTMKSPIACMEQKAAMTMANVDMDTPVCVYISKQEGARRVITAIFTMEEKEPSVGHQIHS